MKNNIVLLKKLHENYRNRQKTTGKLQDFGFLGGFQVVFFEHLPLVFSVASKPQRFHALPEIFSYQGVLVACI